jgi:hypothetical protein
LHCSHMTNDSTIVAVGGRIVKDVAAGARER